jgi:hypothetical protein
MGQELNHYQFINSQTGNVIAYLSLPIHMKDTQRTEQLEKKRAELAIEHKLFYELIFWQDKDGPSGR